jgi:hypothetical protein
LIRPRVDHEEQIARADERTFIVATFLKIALHPRSDLRRDVALGGADPFGIDWHVLLNHVGDDDVGRRGWRRGRLTASGKSERYDDRSSEDRNLDGVAIDGGNRVARRAGNRASSHSRYSLRMGFVASQEAKFRVVKL